ncbi:hypothetical protein GCM10011512_16580 [Tersicoccus solisilvae]|uniref:ABC transporter permease n=1 Tax=Tersicoccus solisilvae TaxID=1882339 RepID=A0ABQ1P428_9MICC|nr:DUF6297 family protein [Tersicoccus solisilvae]GGC90338.1 hypothetical protein GCM10011512_16580 [Tersicoccus solisilvae]
MNAAKLDAHAVTGFDPAAFTRRAARRHRDRSVASAVLDGYTAVLSVGVAGLFGYGLLTALNQQLGAVTVLRPVTDEAAAVLPAGACLPLLGLIVTAAVLDAALRLGPIGPDRAQLTWWLWAPVPRAGMLARLGASRVLAAGAVGALGLLPVLAILTLGPGLMLGSVSGGLLAAIAAEVAVAAQAAGHVRRMRRVAAGLGVVTASVAVALVLCGWLLPAAVPVIAHVLTVAPTGWFVIAAGGAAWPPGALAAVVVALWLGLHRRLGTIATGELARGGGAMQMLQLWAVTGGADDLVRAGPRAVASTVRAHRWIGRVRTAAGALLAADAISTVRQRGWWVYPVLPALAWSPVFVAGANGVVPISLALVVAALAGMDVAARTVRACAAMTELDGLLPLSAARIRQLHAVVPALLLAGMMTVWCAGLVLLGAANPGLIVLGALAGVGLGACAVRSAYRPPVDFSAPPIPSPFGYLPSSALATMSQGPDLAVVVLVPVVVALLIGAAAPLLLGAQAVVVLVVVLIATTPPITS